MSTRLEELYKEEIRKQDKDVWDATNKRGQPTPTKKKETAADKISKLSK